MSLLAWIGLFALESLFFAWILFWGGARRLEGSWLAELLVSYRASLTSADGIRLIAWVLWIGGAVWFLVGIVVPGVRGA